MKTKLRDQGASNPMLDLLQLLKCRPWIRWLCWIGLTSLLILLAGCVPQRGINQPRHSQPAGEIRGERTVGQTFVAHKSGLNRIDVLLATYARDNTGTVTFHLRESPAAERDIATIRFDAAGVEDNAYRTFTFPPLSDSQGRSYYFFLEAPAAEPSNAVTAWSTSTDAYSDGHAYLAGQPQAGDLAFRTYVEYTIAEIASDLWHGLWRHTGTAMLAIALFLVPGAAALSVLIWGMEIGDWRLGVCDTVGRPRRGHRSSPHLVHLIHRASPQPQLHHHPADLNRHFNHTQ